MYAVAITTRVVLAIACAVGMITVAFVLMRNRHRHHGQRRKWAVVDNRCATPQPIPAGVRVFRTHVACLAGCLYEAKGECVVGVPHDLEGRVPIFDGLATCQAHLAKRLVPGTAGAAAAP